MNNFEYMLKCCIKEKVGGGMDSALLYLSGSFLILYSVLEVNVIT